MRAFGIWGGIALLVAACGGGASDDDNRTTREQEPEPRGEDSSEDAGVPEPEPTPQADAGEPEPDAPEPDEPADPPVVPIQPEPAMPPVMTSEPDPVPVPEPIDLPPEPVPTPDPAPTGDPVLVYLGGSIAGIRNARDGSPWIDFQGSISTFEGGAPWSLDGQRVVDRRGDEIVFFDRAEDGFVQGTSVVLPSTLRRWLGNEAVVTVGGAEGEELWLVRPDGSTTLVTDAHGPIVSVSSSPDGTHLLFDTTSDGVFSVYGVTLTDGVPSSPIDLNVHAQSPMLSQVWSADGRWLAAGFSGGDASGIQVYDTQTGAFRRVTPEGANYNPLYGFAPGRNVLSVYASLAETSELGVVSLDTDFAWQPVASEMPTPGEWSRDGAYLLHGFDGTGALVPVDATGVVGAPIPFPEGEYGCPAHWISATQFYTRDCSQPSIVYLASVEASSVSRELVVSDALPTPTQSPDGRCFVATNGAELAFGSYTPEYVETARIVSNLPAVFAFEPDSSGVAWADATGARFQSLDFACAPIGSPVNVEDISNITAVVLLPE